MTPRAGDRGDDHGDGQAERGGSDGDHGRDAWLSGALRHAPDARADAPPALSEQILRAAHQAATQPRAASAALPAARPAHGWALAWRWIARPPVAAGFAGMLVAVLVGTMWLRQWPGETDAPPAAWPSAPAVTAAAPRNHADAVADADAGAGADAASATAQSTQPAGATANVALAAKPSPPPTAAAASRGKRASTDSTAPSRRSDDPRGAASPVKPRSAATQSQPEPQPAPPRSRPLSPPPAPPAPAAPPFATTAAAPAPAAEAADGAHVAEATQAAPAAPTAPLPAPLPAPLLARSPGAAVVRGYEAAGMSAATTATAAETTTAAEAVVAPRNPTTATHRADAGSAQNKSAAAMAAPLADLRARMAREPARWRWQRPHGDAASREPQPITDALQAWLAALDQRSASQWRVAAGGAVEGAGHSSSRSNTAQLRLTRDGVLQATIGFDRSGVWVDGNAGAAHAAMSPPAIDALRSSLREALRLATP